MAFSSKFLFLIILLVPYCTTTQALKHKISRIQFYSHEIGGGSNHSLVLVAARSNFTSPDPIASSFGSVFVIDNPLTATPDFNSTLLGRAQGIQTMSSQQNEFSLLMTFTCNFISGPFNGSSFSVLGRNPIRNEVREMPVVGGTGKFRLATGYALLRTHLLDQVAGVAVVEYNVTLLHY